MPWLGKRESWRVPVQACTPQRMTAELAGRISPQLAASSFHQPSLCSLHNFTCTRPANISTQTIRGCLSLHPCDHLELTMAKAMPFFLPNPSLPALSSGSPHSKPPWFPGAVWGQQGPCPPRCRAPSRHGWLHTAMMRPLGPHTSPAQLQPCP